MNESIPVGAAALRLCAAAIKEADMPNPAARIAAWLIGVAAKRGGFPIEVSYRQIQLGIEKDGENMVGTHCHNTTIRESLKWLADSGLITVEQGAYLSGGHHAVLISAR